MENSEESSVNMHSEESYFQASNFTSTKILNIAKPPEKGVDGDWERVFKLLKNNCDRHGHHYFTGIIGVENGRTILHYACIQKSKQAAMEAVQTIFEFCIEQHMEVKNRIDFVNKKDKEGNTALQLATKKRNKALIKMLIEHGANVDLLKRDTSTKAIHMIYDKVLISIFDKSINLEKDDDDDELANESVWKVDCNFGPITGLHNLNSTYQETPKKPINQTRHLAWVLRRETVTRAAILQHPLVQIFLHIKGKKFAIFLYLSLVYHILWSLLSSGFIFCNTHILNSTNIGNTSNDSNLAVLCRPFRIYNEYESGVNENESGVNEFRCNAYFYIMIFLHLMSVAKEIVELHSCPDWWYYWKQLENLGQWVVNFAILVVWMMPIVGGTPEKSSFEPTVNEICPEKKLYVWKIILPSIYFAGIFASLLLIQGQLTKIEELGIYNEMFAKGFQNVMKFLLAFLPLLTAFLIIFHILLPMNKEFLPSWGLGFTKLLSMMVDDVDYGDVFYEDNEAEIAFRNVYKFVVLVFVITVVILLHNLLIGMTVSDIQKLEKKAKVNYLARLLDDINMMENLIVHPWVVKLVLHFKLEHSFKKAFIVDKIDTQKQKYKADGTVKIRNKRLDEYPPDSREAIIQWDKRTSF